MTRLLVESSPQLNAASTSCRRTAQIHFAQEGDGGGGGRAGEMVQPPCDDVAASQWDLTCGPGGQVLLPVGEMRVAEGDDPTT